MRARMPSQIFWSSASTFATYSHGVGRLLLVALGLLFLLHAGDDPPRCTSTTDGVLVRHRQQIPLLHRKFRWLLPDPLHVLCHLIIALRLLGEFRKVDVLLATGHGEDRTEVWSMHLSKRAS